MKKFLTNISIFLLFPLAFFGANALVNYYFILQHKVEMKPARVVIAGDSHPMTSLNPEIFESAVNISQSAEPYILTYWKLQKIIDEVKPDTVILGFAPHNFSGFNDYKFSDRLWADELFKRIYPIANFESIDGNIDIDYTHYYRSIWKQIAFYPRPNHGRYIGSFDNRSSSNLSNFRQLIQDHFYYKGNEVGVSELSINYLDSIATICKENSVALILVNNPVHQSYKNLIPEIHEKTYDSLKTKYSDSYVIIDKTNDPYPDSLFFNADHLNGIGANRFTLEIKKLLNTSK